MGDVFSQIMVSSPYVAGRLAPFRPSIKVTVDLQGCLNFRRIIRMCVACALTTEKYISS